MELNVIRCTEINVRNQQIVSLEAIELDFQKTNKRNYNLEIRSEERRVGKEC